MYMWSRKPDSNTYMLLECSKLVSERNSFKSAMLRTHGKWTYNTQQLITGYTKEFIDYMNSIKLDSIQG